MSYKYRMMCDGIDVDVGGRTLHIVDKKTKPAAIEAAAVAFAALVKDEKPLAPPVDYAERYHSLRAVVESAVKDAKATKAQLVAALSGALSTAVETAVAAEGRGA